MKLRNNSRFFGLLIMALLGSGCASGAMDTEYGSADAPEPEPRGGIVDFAPWATDYLPLADNTTSLLRIRYESSSGLDADGHTVSAVVAVPIGTPPLGGWPVAAVAHGTTGITQDCAPSSNPGLSGLASTVAAFVDRGYVVVATDYQGLGEPDTHPYLEPKTAAYNVIDSVRAARSLVPGASGRWIAYGGSQGGQAVWAANEESATYGSGLDLAAVIALSPAADLTGLGPAAENGTLTAEQLSVYPLVVAGIATAYPDVDVQNFVDGAPLESLPMLQSCTGENQRDKDRVLNESNPGEFEPADRAAADRLNSWLEAIRLPKAISPAPMLIIYGGNDGLVLPEWIEGAAEQACSQGASIDLLQQPMAGHAVNPVPALDWLASRMENQPRGEQCPGILE
ncbi:MULTISPECIES: alpha/beta hydrolase family protein [Rhodococcus]|uniref:Lipase family protein n=1 Tax=Rhodococcus cerastii TaxID=908616 RepID=A0ABU4D3X4_9NOCA|nr:MULTISPECIES: lipase family protein [Rhodococcus]MDV6304424.1 lipase family protein [Rhodococcus cerastii]MDV7991240.1 lipase family protein [Rhodococcus sp. IEGM 1374]MDV8077541.1 lipase family protein [Rhodococcus sp. IEGM 1370]